MNSDTAVVIQIPLPPNKKDIAYCLNTDTVLLNNSISFEFINKDVILFANNKDTENTVTEVIRTVLSPNLSK